MMKKMSLRTRLTLLSAIVLTSVAVILSTVSMISANRIFVQGVQQQLNKDLSLSVQTSDIDISKKIEVALAPSGDNTDDVTLSQAKYTAISMTLSKAGQEFNMWGIIGLALITLLGIGATWYMAGQALKPVQELYNAIDEIDEKDLSRRVNTHGRQDEIGRLGKSFNAMMDKVSASFERQKRFSASAAHELKTPLTTIQLGLEVLELDDNPNPEQMKKVLSVTKNNTDRMVRLVSDLFSLSTDDAYEMDEVMSVQNLFSDIKEELLPIIQARSLNVTIVTTPEIKLTGNRILLYRALFNLTENAAKYNREGGFISLTAYKEGEAVNVCVSDNGIGIPQEELPHIFEPFYRVDRSRSRAMGGSGLGLSLVKEIIEKHGGSIEVESVLGEGTSFMMRFFQTARYRKV